MKLQKEKEKLLKQQKDREVEVSKFLHDQLRSKMMNKFEPQQRLSIVQNTSNIISQKLVQKGLKDKINLGSSINFATSLKCMRKTNKDSKINNDESKIQPINNITIDN